MLLDPELEVEMKKIQRDLTKSSLTVTIGKSSCWPSSRAPHVMKSRMSKSGARKSGFKQPSSRRGGKSK